MITNKYLEELMVESILDFEDFFKRYNEIVSNELVSTDWLSKKDLIPLFEIYLKYYLKVK